MSAPRLAFLLIVNFLEDEACYQANFYTPGTKTLQIINSLICNPDKIPSYQLANNYRNVPVPNRL